jgi:tetratricopeptide (TPR) repeat protein
MSRVFISYRRADSASSATKLYRHLSIRFGKDLIFQDVDDIKPGADFLETLRQELKLCQVFLILIGPRWLIDTNGRRRLDDPNDVLRMEVAEALSRDATVLPVLVEGADMPSPESLPEPLQPLSRRQAMSLAEDNWIPNVEALIDRLREIILPRAEDIPLPQAERELYEMQLRYFDLLDRNCAADALDLAQKTQVFLDRVLPLYPQDPNLKVTRGYLYKNEAMALARLGRYNESESALMKGESIFRTMLDERPRDAGAWNGLGSIEAVRGNYEKAHEYVDTALNILPDYPAAQQDHELILQRLGKTTCNGMKSSSTQHRSKK